VGLTCELSPLVFSELYRLLAQDRTRSDPLAERLAGIELDHDWLGQVADEYGAKWIEEVSLSAADPNYAMSGLSEEHALLASWILAGLRSTGSSLDLSAELNRNVLTRAIADLPGSPNPAELPATLNPSVTSWILGMVVGRLDRTLPVVPARLPSDPHVAGAYLGLVEHVVHLGDVPAPWSEMLGTSTIWRGTGIAEALTPDIIGQQKSINALLGEARHYIPEHLLKRLITHFHGFVDRRDVLSHILPKKGGITFQQATQTALTWDDIRLTLVAITQFVCQQVATELTESPASRAVRPDTWDYLRYEIMVNTS
jgi:hypothetical protein